jgi:hypothetical protein
MVGSRVWISLPPLMAVGMLLSFGRSAFAQSEQSEALGVMDRPRPEYDAKGIPLGGFRLFPTLDLAAAYDDNVRRLETGEADWYFLETPAARLQSQWGRHFLEFYAGANNYNYTKATSLNLTDWDAGSDGRLDVIQGASISSGGSYGEYHEPLYSPNTEGNQASPNRYQKSMANVTGTYAPDRVGISLGGQFQRVSYDNAPLIGGGSIDNADRDEDEYEGYLSGTYKFSPGYTAFVKFDYDTRHFDEFFDRTGAHRDSIGYRVTGGLNLQLSHLLTGEISAGYLEQHYDQHQAIYLPNAAGLDFGAQLDWYATDLMTVHLSGGRYISDVVLAGASASDDKVVKLNADYEILPNLIGQAYFSYDSSSLRGISRTDNYPSAGIGTRYLMNEYLSANLMYNYSERASNFPGADYTDNTLSLTVTGHI